MKKKNPKILYRADGAEFHLQSNGKYELSESTMDNPYQYERESFDSEFFSSTLKESQEKQKHREIGFRWVKKIHPYPDGTEIILEKYNMNTTLWEKIPTIIIK